jgi:hypothetical protein
MEKLDERKREREKIKAERNKKYKNISVPHASSYVEHWCPWFRPLI